jgi:transposase
MEGESIRAVCHQPDQSVSPGRNVKRTPFALPNSDPFSGAVYVFRATRTDRVQPVHWDGAGVCLFAKQLEDGKFRCPNVQDGVIRLSAAQLSALLEGLDCRRVHAGRHRCSRDECGRVNQPGCMCSRGGGAHDLDSSPYVIRLRRSLKAIQCREWRRPSHQIPKRHRCHRHVGSPRA